MELSHRGPRIARNFEGTKGRDTVYPAEACGDDPSTHLYFILCHIVKEYTTVLLNVTVEKLCHRL